VLCARVRDGYSPTTPPEADLQPSESPVDGVTLDLEFHSRQAAFERLARVEVALARFEAGTYGTCEACSGQVEPKRLDHDPATALCLECQSASEKPRRTPKM
jgi:RNA polymerase-binding transcription factor DksA